MGSFPVSSRLWWERRQSLCPWPTANHWGRRPGWCSVSPPTPGPGERKDIRLQEFVPGQDGTLATQLVTINTVNLSHLLETRYNVPRNGADQRCDVIHEAFGEAILPGWLQAIGEVQVVNNALHLRLGEENKYSAVLSATNSHQSQSSF